MPGVARQSLDHLLRTAERCIGAWHPGDGAVPRHRRALKTPDGQRPWNPDGLVPRVVRALKSRFPELGVMTDVALGPSPATARMA